LAENNLALQKQLEEIKSRLWKDDWWAKEIY
jgi:hypothetical protein